MPRKTTCQSIPRRIGPLSNRPQHMFGPQMKQACPMCTSVLDSVEGAAMHLSQRANLAVVAKSPIARRHELAQQRDWRHLRLLSSANNSYNRDYSAKPPQAASCPC